MEKVEFKKTIKTVLNNYGFITQGKYHYLDLEKVFIIATIFPVRGNYTLSFNFSLKEIHDESERKKGDLFTGYDASLIDTVSAKGVKFFELEKLKSIKKLEHDILERVHRYFDPFRLDPVKHIIKKATDPNKDKRGDSIILYKEIKKYLNLNN